MRLRLIALFAVAAVKAAPIPMKHLAAYLLLGLSGITSPTMANVKALLDSVGIEAEDERLSNLLKELDGKDSDDLITGRSTQVTKGLGKREESDPIPEECEECEGGSSSSGGGLLGSGGLLGTGVGTSGGLFGTGLLGSGGSSSGGGSTTGGLLGGLGIKRRTVLISPEQPLDMLKRYRRDTNTGRGDLNLEADAHHIEVAYSKYGGTEIKVDGEKYLIFREDDVLGVVGKRLADLQPAALRKRDAAPIDLGVKDGTYTATFIGLNGNPAWTLEASTPFGGATISD